MRFINLLKEITLRELGNTTDTYRLRNVTMGVFPRIDPPEVDAVWEFSTENYDYEVHVFNEFPEFLTVDFSTDQTGSKVTGEGNPFRVTATVIEAAKRTFERLKDMGGEFDLIKGFRFKGVPKKGSDREETQRNKLYTTFIRNQFPSASIERMDHGEYKVTL